MKPMYLFLVFAMLLSGCSYTYNPRARALKNADLLEQKGDYPAAMRLRTDAASMRETGTGHYIPLLQTRPKDTIQTDPRLALEEYQDKKSLSNYQLTYSTPTKKVK